MSPTCARRLHSARCSPPRKAYASPLISRVCRHTCRTWWLTWLLLSQKSKPMIETADIEKRIDHAIAAPMPIDNAGGGLAPQTAGEAMELAKMMAVSGAAVPVWLRNNPGCCLAICFRALRWQMDPFAVAEKSY